MQHRQVGIGEVCWRRDSVIDGVEVRIGQLVHQTCNYYVQITGIVFECDECQYKCRHSRKSFAIGTRNTHHKFVEYKTFLPEWDIAPDRTNRVSKYWMWVIATYQHQLKN